MDSCRDPQMKDDESSYKIISVIVFRIQCREHMINNGEDAP